MERLGDDSAGLSVCREDRVEAVTPGGGGGHDARECCPARGGQWSASPTRRRLAAEGTAWRVGAEAGCRGLASSTISMSQAGGSVS